jgi:hypothetical protein
MTEVTSFLFVLGAIAYSWIFAGKKRGYVLKGPIVAITCFVICLSPWVLRNYIVFNKIGMLRTGSGSSLLWGLRDVGSNISIPEKRLIALEKEGRTKNEADEDDALKKELMSLIGKNYFYYIRKEIFGNFISFWWETNSYHNVNTVKYLLGRKIPYILLLILSLPGFVLGLYDS